jgi:hypothetical protein
MRFQVRGGFFNGSPLTKYYLRATGERFQEESLEPPIFEKNCLTMEIVILLKMNKFVYLRKSRRT